MGFSWIRDRRATLLMLLAVLLAGIAQLAWLPPWEGFDETAHWSSIQQIAQTGTIPRYGIDLLAADLSAYPGPMPYASAPPFEANGGLTYRTFAATTLAGGPSRWAPAGAYNWQAQHPPLYYLMMAPLSQAAAGLGWVDHFLVLRLASWLLAVAGLAIGVLASRPLVGERGTVVMAAWPFLVPQFIPEMARIGNDSLCLLLTGAVWALLPRVEAGGSRWWPVGLGVVLGLGLWTKAFFLPITAGVAAYLTWRAWSTGGRPAARAAALAIGVAVLMGGAWYLRNLLDIGAAVGGDEFRQLDAHGGLLASLAGGLSPTALARGLAAMAASFVWAGTWSLARPPEVLLLGPLLLLAVAAAGWATRLRRAPSLLWAPLFLLTPMLAGLAYHLVMRVATTGRGAGTPGWYLHILAVPLALVVAWGWRRPRLLAGLAAYGLCFTAGAWVLQLALFSGCAVKGEDHGYAFAANGCVIDVGRLAVLGHPALGLAALGAGLICAGLALRAAQITSDTTSSSRRTVSRSRLPSQRDGR